MTITASPDLPLTRMAGILQLTTGGDDQQMKNFFYKKKSYEGVGSLSSLAWKRFRKDMLAMGSFFLVIIATLLATLGYLITPDSTPFANEQHLEIAAKKPGYKVTMLRVRNAQKEVSTGVFGKMIYGKK